jgi:hypothetical protein
MQLDKSKLWIIMTGLAVLSLTVWGAATGTTGGGPVLSTRPPITSVEPQQIEPQPDVVIPAGTPLRIRLDNAVSTANTRSGDHFSGTVVSPATVDGAVILPAGTSVRGYVATSAPSGRLKGRAVLSLRLTSVSLHGRTILVSTASDTRVSAGHKKRNLLWIGGGTGGGLLIGALAGGPVGAAIGAGSGAAAGVAGAAITGRRQIRLPAETEMTFRLSRPLRVPHPVSG